MTHQISSRELANQLGSKTPPHLLDVRELDEHQFVALPNSRLIPLGQLAARLDELSSWKQEAVVVYCHHGIRSLHAIALLRQAGFSDLKNLSGGIDGWSLDVDPSLPRY